MININDNSKKQIYFKVLISICILIFAIMLGCLSIKHKSKYAIHYSDTSNLDYNVYLRKNDFFQAESLPKDKKYIASLIDYIDADFSYRFNMKEDIKLNYNYTMVANVLVDSSDGKNIYSKEEELISSDINGKNVNNVFIINENIKIDYNKYNKLATSLIDNYGINANARVVVGMYVTVKDVQNNYKRKLYDTAVISLEIPLGSTTTEVKMNYDLKNNNNKEFYFSNTTINNLFLLALSIILLAVDVGFVGINIRKYYLNRTSKDKYQSQLQKIFKNYSRYISKKSTKLYERDILYTKSLRIETVETFDDLMNVRDNIEKPIMYYESKYEEQSIFYIIDVSICYVYVMSVQDFIGKHPNMSLDYTSKRLNRNNNKMEMDNEII